MQVHILDTAIGAIGLAWSEQGLTRLSLPGRDGGARARRLPGQPGGDELPVALRPVGEAIRRYAAGEPQEFFDVPIDLSAVDDPFRLAVYSAARALRYGETTTYGELAARAGYPGLARDVGAALGTNPLPLIVPCHRVVAAGGKIGGFSAPGGAATKERLLRLEGVRIGPPEPAQAAFSF